MSHPTRWQRELPALGFHFPFRLITENRRSPANTVESRILQFVLRPYEADRLPAIARYDGK